MIKFIQEHYYMSREMREFLYGLRAMRHMLNFQTLLVFSSLFAIIVAAIILFES